jgi:DNA-binding transcriptional LysR family regulator
MDIRNLRQILALRQHGSFAKAARALGMSQPNLSTSVARLEDQFGVKLVDRTAAGSELTPVGELVADRAARVIGEMQRLVRDTELVAGGEAGLVRIGVGSALCSVFLPQFALAIARAYPKLRFHIEVNERDRLAPLLIERELDLIVCALSEDVTGGELVYTEVLECDGVALAAPAHALAGKRDISPAEFADHIGGGSSSRNFHNYQIMDLKQEPENSSFYTSNEYSALIPIAIDGRCTLIAPDFVAKPYLDSGELVRLDVAWSYSLSFVAVTTRASSLSPALRGIVQLAVETGRSV